MVEEIIQNYEENWLEESPVVRLYHFTNYNQGPELTYYDLPSEVFRFLVLVKQHPDVLQWRQMVRLAYRITARDKDEELAHKKVRNEIYQRLINRRTVVPYFFSRQARQTHVSWGLLALYLQEVRKMGSKRIDTVYINLEALAEVLSDYSRELRSPVYIGRRKGFMDDIDGELRAFAEGFAGAKIHYGTINEAVAGFTAGIAAYYDAQAGGGVL
jgi:CRISPR-associated protein Cst1